MRQKHTVREWRRLKDITLQQMADAIGTSRLTYTRYESDPGRMTIKTGLKVADVLGVPFDDISFL